MKKRPRRRPAEPPPAGRARTRRAAAAGEPGPVQYKVVELSVVDEQSLERALNEWVGRGWTLDGLQFAMRESSRRPAMAFVLFTREGEEAAPLVHPAQARERLRRLAEEGSPTAALARASRGAGPTTLEPRE